MKQILPATLLLTLALATAVQAQRNTLTFFRKGVTETYQANICTSELTINLENDVKVLTDIVGYAGQTSRMLVSFNNEPALAYENAGSNTYFEVFYTLTLKGKDPFINCVYGNIRNGQNGMSIRKAVCNLDKPLTSKYEDLIFAYSDKWIEASNTVSLQSVMAEPPQTVEARLDRLGEVDVALRYSSVEELMSATPKTIATAGAKTYEMSSGNAYLVYDADGITPLALALDVEMDPVTHTLKRLTPTDLLLGIEAN